MNLTELFKTPDELAEFCMLPDNAAQDARIAERIAELSRQGVIVMGLQCTRQRDPQ